MRYIIVIVFLYATSVCMAQERYYNEEFGFAFDIPSKWYITFEDELSDDAKKTLAELYWSENLLVLSPYGIDALEIPCILTQGRKSEESFNSKNIRSISMPLIFIQNHFPKYRFIFHNIFSL